MATTPDLQEPQIAAARSQAWRQDGDPLLTLDAARDWLSRFGMVLFSPMAGTLGAPSPSLVEATLGQARASATLAETGTARGLTARLVGEGSALPLNLLGGPGDLPDFLVTAQSFPFVFTLRGDKGWKRPPETSGASRVTPLALRVYELLAEKGALAIAAIVPEIGREVTESAVGRALSELWQLLRVIPVLQQGEGETVWELTTTRFLKAVKAGANAGQPTALSGLVSSYLAQVLVASEEEIAGFLSPLTARSRVRDVLHGLTAGRQLAEGVVEGKTVLYIPELLPDFSRFAAGGTDEATSEAGGEKPAEEGQSAERDTAEVPRERIRRFAGEGADAKDRNFRGKPVRREGKGRPDRASGGKGPRREGLRNDRGPGEFRREGTANTEDRGLVNGTRGPRPDRGPRYETRGERSGTGFRREQGPSKAAFTRPWEEEGRSRSPRDKQDGERAPRTRADRPQPREGGGERRSPSTRRDFGGKTTERGQSRAAGPRNFREADQRDEQRSVRSGRSFPPRGEGAGRPFRARTENSERPFRARTENSSRPFRPFPEGGGRPFRPKSGEGAERPFRPRRDEGERPFRPRTEGAGERPFRPREGNQRDAQGGRGGSGQSRNWDRRGPGGPPAGRFGGNRAGSERREGEGGERRPPRRFPSGGGPRGDSGGGAPRGPRQQGGGLQDRRGPMGRPGGRPGGGFGRSKDGPRPGGWRKAGFQGPGTRPGGRGGEATRPDRPARPPRGEDEA